MEAEQGRAGHPSWPGGSSQPQLPELQVCLSAEAWGVCCEVPFTSPASFCLLGSLRPLDTVQNFPSTSSQMSKGDPKFFLPCQALLGVLASLPLQEVPVPQGPRGQSQRTQSCLPEAAREASPVHPLVESAPRQQPQAPESTGGGCYGPQIIAIPTSLLHLPGLSIQEVGPCWREICDDADLGPPNAQPSQQPPW